MDKLTIKPYSSFDCYNSIGDNALKGHAKTFVGKINRAIEAGKTDKEILKTFEKAMAAYIRSYNRFKNSENGLGSGASDTAVRGVVYSFCVRVGRAVDFNKEAIDFIWDKELD